MNLWRRFTLSNASDVIAYTTSSWPTPPEVHILVYDGLAWRIEQVIFLRGSRRRILRDVFRRVDRGRIFLNESVINIQACIQSDKRYQYVGVARNCFFLCRTGFPRHAHERWLSICGQNRHAYSQKLSIHVFGFTEILRCGPEQGDARGFRVDERNSSFAANN